jgi:hypothetical protein
MLDEYFSYVVKKRWLGRFDRFARQIAMQVFGHRRRALIAVIAILSDRFQRDPVQLARNRTFQQRRIALALFGYVGRLAQGARQPRRRRFRLGIANGLENFEQTFAVNLRAGDRSRACQPLISACSGLMYSGVPIRSP